MEKITERHNVLGRVEFYRDFDRKFFLARPHGVINPSLLEKDVEMARSFANTCNAPWTYITNAEDVKIVNPLNLLFLKEVKKIKHLKRIVIFAPDFFNRILIRMVSPIVQPDLILSDKEEFQKLLSTVK